MVYVKNSTFEVNILLNEIKPRNYLCEDKLAVYEEPYCYVSVAVFTAHGIDGSIVFGIVTVTMITHEPLHLA